MNTLKKKSWTRLCHQLKNLDIIEIAELNKENLEKIRIPSHNKSVVKNQNKNRINNQRIMAWNTNNKSVVKMCGTSFLLLEKWRLCQGQLKNVCPQ